MATATLRIHNIGSLHPEITGVLGEPSEAHVRGDSVSAKFSYLKETVWENDIWMKQPSVEVGATLETQLESICKLLLAHTALIRRLASDGGHLDVYCSLASDVKEYFTIKASKLRILSDLGVDLTLSIFPDTLYPKGYPAIKT